MPQLLLSGAVLAVLLLVLWAIRAWNQRVLGERTTPRFYAVDIAAFRNLLSPNEEEFLRSALTRGSYRKVRRARLRAIQEYLLWIAANCATLTAMLRLRISDPELASGLETEPLVREAVRLRLISLTFWILLWIEFLLPSIRIRPSAALKQYEDVWRFAEGYFRNQMLEPAITSADASR